MGIDYPKIIESFEEENISSTQDLVKLANMLQTTISRVPKDDLIVSLVLVDFTRDPVALISKFRSDNFKGFKDKYYNRLGQNLQTIPEESLIYHLITDESLVVIENVDDIDLDAPVSSFEKDFMQDNGWKTAIFHTLFYETIIYGYIAVFTTETLLNDIEIDLILDYSSNIFPEISKKLLPIAYKWKSHIHKRDIEEIEANVSDLIVAITGRGIVVRINNLSNYYLGRRPDQILGKHLEQISKPLYDGIMKSIDNDCHNEYPIQIEVYGDNNQRLQLELETWETSLTTDETIICFARDITLLKLYEGIVGSGK